MSIRFFAAASKSCRFMTDTLKNSRTLKCCMLVLTLGLVVQSSGQAGVWTQLTNQMPAGGCGAMMLLTDGTVLVQGPDVTNVWFKLSPDNAGNYINGTWTQAASMNLQRLFFGSNVLPSGKVFVLGGEYSGASGAQNITNTGEIYDPDTNTWSSIPDFPQLEFGDDPTVVLPNGKILCGYIFDNSTYLFDPNTLTWSQTGPKLRGDRSDEETWLLLPGGRILSYDVFSSTSLQQGRSQIYNTQTGRWTDAGILPAILSDSTFGFELGPGGLLPDGRVILFGANNKSAIYTPATNSWVAGPSLPAKMGADDAPGCMLPNGHFLVLADTSVPIFSPPTRIFDFDYTTNSLTDVTPTTGPSALLASSDAFPFRLVMLPNGHMLLGHRDTGLVYDYQPDGAPLPAWQPTIVSAVKSGTSTSTTYTLTGTQLTGISEGGCYGDDVEMSTNYPIVKLKSSKGVVTYPKTTNWTPGVATGSLRTTCQFTLPKNFPNDTYQLSVSANGISSANFPFRIGAAQVPSNVTAVFNATTKTLTIIGDANPNSLTITLQAGVLTVLGANGTTVNHTTQFQTNVTGSINISATMSDGDDAVSMIGITATTASIDLGAGNDKAAFTLCHIQNLTVNGGVGVDSVLTTSSTVSRYTPSLVP